MERRNHNITFLGKKGFGKTFKARLMSWDLNRVIIFDPTNEFNGGIHIHSIALFDRWAYTLNNRENYRVVLKLENRSDYVDGFDIIWNDAKVTHTTVIIDEIQNWAKGNSVDENIANMLSMGRHRNLSVWAIARRPYEMARIITSQSDQIITFAHSDDRDLDFLKRRGFDPNVLMQLKKKEFVLRETE